MNINKRFVMLACLAALCATAPDLPAQTPTATTSLEEVIVTARKRDEASLDVPVAVNVFTAADIEAAGIERPQDFIDLTPNMTLVQTQNQGTSFVTVRGISQARNSEPSVAVVIDGVAMANPSQFNQELIDIESIQVLKGPQGALYGRNAIGGAIIITSKQPTDEFEGRISAGYDSGPGYRVGATVSGPISDTLKYRATVSYLDTDGYIDNPFLRRGSRSVRGSVGARAAGVGAERRFPRGPARIHLRRLDAGAVLQHHRERERHEPAGAGQQSRRQRSRAVRRVAEARLELVLRHDHVRDRVRQAGGDPHRRSVQLPADPGVGAVPVLPGRPGAAPVPRRRRGEPGAALHVARRPPRALDLRRVRDLDRSLHLDRQRHRHRRRHRARSAAHAADEVRHPDELLPAGLQAVHLSRGLAGQLRLGAVRRPELRHHRPARRLGGAALRRGRAREHDRDARELPADADLVPGPGAQEHLGRAAAEGDVALQARGRSHALRRLQPRLPQRRFQSDRRRRGEHCRHRRPVRQGDRRHLRGGIQGRVHGPAARHQPEPVLHAGQRLVLLRLRCQHQHAEPRQPRRRRLQGPGARAQGARHRQLRRVPRRRLHGQRDQGIRPRRDRRRQPGAAGFRVQRQPGSGVSSGAGGVRRRERRSCAPTSM